MGELEITNEWLEQLRKDTPKSLALRDELKRTGKKDPPRLPKADMNNLPIPGKDYPEPE